MALAPSVTITLPSIPLAVLESVSTIAALRARPSSGFIDGDNIAVDGTLSSGDGGGGLFTWNDLSVADDDGLNVIKPTDISPLAAGRWILVGGGDFYNLSGPTGASLIGAGSSNVLALLGGENLTPLYYGAVGNGATNDKDIIDTLNAAGASVNLAGRSYAYTGDFVPLAKFTNGQIISSTLGTFDYRTDKVLAGEERVLTVGAAGTMKTLAAAAAWWQSLTIYGTLRVRLLELNTPNNSSGSMALDNCNARHMGPGEIILEGPDFAVGQGAFRYSDIPNYSTVKADLAAFGTFRTAVNTYMRTQFGASIYLVGNDDLLGGPGIRGSFHFRRLHVECHGRYSTDNAFNGSHSASESGQQATTFENCAVVGGVWGTIGAYQLTKSFGHNTFACQISGGPFIVIGGKFFVTAGTLDLYFPRITTPFANMPQAAITVHGGAFEAPPNSVTIYGPFLSGVLTRGKSSVLVQDAITTNYVTQPYTITDNSNAVIGVLNISNANPANTSATPGATQDNVIGNSTQKCAVFAGRNSNVSLSGGTLTNCDGLISYVMADGGTITTFNKVTAVSSRCPGGGSKEFAAINGGRLIGKFGLVTPVAGGNNWYFVADGGRIDLFGAHDGTLAFNQTLGSTKHDSIISDGTSGGGTGGLFVQGTTLLTAQQAAIADLGVAPTAANYNAILAVLRAHKLIAP